MVFLALSCIGTRSIKSQIITRKHIYIAAAVGSVLFLLNGPLLRIPMEGNVKYVLYACTLCAGYLCLLAAGIWIGRLWSVRMMDDPFNIENESFQQETRRMWNEYSVNLPTLFYYKKRWNSG